MKTSASIWFILLLSFKIGLLVKATNLHVVNNGASTVCAKYWVPNEIGGGCEELEPGQAWDVAATPRWESATMWAERGSCWGEACNAGPPSGKTQFEITVAGFANNDYYQVSMLAGFNVGLSVTPTNSVCAAQDCSVPDRCQGAVPGVSSRTKACRYGSTDYTIAFYPA